MSLTCYLFNIEPYYFWPCVWLVIILIAILYNVYVRRNCGRFKDTGVSLEGKTVIITGANGGLGKETAKYMAKKGCRLIMACRNLQTAQEARDEIVAESENQNVVIYQIDLSSFTSIREFASKVLKEETRIDILIHNAAHVGVFKKNKSIEDIELTMTINVYGPFLLTHLLMDLMKKSVPSKIIMVSSKSHTLTSFNPKKTTDLNPVDFWPPLMLYSKSKHAGILFMYELAKRLQGSGVTANVLHPGTFDSPIWNVTPFPYNICVYISRKFMKTTQQAIQTTLHVAMSPEVNGVNGQYFRDCKIGKSHRRTYDKEKQFVFWNEAERIVQLGPCDPRI